MAIIYVSYDGDGIGARIGQARLHDDVVEVKRVNQAIEAGNRAFYAFVDSTFGAEMIEVAGDEGCFMLPPDKLSEIPRIAKQYSDLVGATVSIGIGMSLSQSSKALLIAKLRGKKQLCVWVPEMQAEIDEAMKNLPSEAVKLHEAYLGHEDSDILGKSADPADIQKRLQPFVPKSTPPVSLPPVRQPDVPQDAPINHEEEFHNIAQAQGAKDLQGQQHSKETLEQIKEGVTETLQNLRLQLPAIAQLQQTSPEAYQSIIALVQSVVSLGKETMSSLPTITKSEVEDLAKALSMEPGKRVQSKLEPHPRAKEAKIFSRTFDYSHLLPADEKNSGFKLQVEHRNTMLPKGVKSIPIGESPHLLPIRPIETIHSTLHSPTGAEIGTVRGHVSKKGHDKLIEPHSELDAPYRGKGLGTAMYEAVYSHAKQTGVNRVSGGVHSPDAHALHTRLSAKHGFHYKSAREPDIKDNFFPYKPYSYALKSEMDGHENEDGFIGKGHGPIFYRDEVVNKDEGEATESSEGQKRATGANSGGAQSGRAHMNLPVGTLLNGKTKMINGETGLANWRSVKGGAIASQLHNPPILGANSSATSANNPDR